MTHFKCSFDDSPQYYKIEFKSSASLYSFFVPILLQIFSIQLVNLPSNQNLQYFFNVVHQTEGTNISFLLKPFFTFFIYVLRFVLILFHFIFVWIQNNFV